MRKNANHSHAHVYSFLRAQKSLLCACKSVYFIYFLILAALYVVTLRKSMENKNIYR